MNRIDLQDRVAVITGGARGIGYAIAQRMLQSGAQVALWDRDSAQLQQAQQGLAAALAAEPAVAGVARSADAAARISTQAVELTMADQVAAATAATLKRHGRIDILVNNAGITGGNATLWQLDPDIWRQVIEVNLIAPYLVCRAVVPHMIERKWGRIVNIASVAGKEGNPNASHYSASKAGLIGMTKSLAKELAGHGVLVNAVSPAVAKTEMFASMTQQHIDYMLGKIPMARFLEVDELAAMVAWLASPDCAFSTGAVFDISGGRATY